MTSRQFVAVQAVWRRIVEMLAQANDLDPQAVDQVRRIAQRLSRPKPARSQRRPA
jgi:hypothetical protein